MSVHEATQLEKTVREAGIYDECVIEAIHRVPRHTLTSGHRAGVAYEDRVLPIEAGLTISQPHVVALRPALRSSLR